MFMVEKTFVLPKKIMNFDVFTWTKEDFNFVLDQDNDSKKNKFDDLIHTKWEDAEKKNVFRYNLKIREQKILNGKYNFFVQFNQDRAQNRRKPENICSMKTEFNPAQFNFMKIKNEEILFYVGKGDENDVIAVNVSPFEFGHCLFIPERLKGLPQVATETSMIKVIELFLCSTSPFLRAVFNSLCGHASVNHLHWHFYYLKQKMLLERIETEKFYGPLETITNYPAKGFCVKLSSFNKNPMEFAKFGFRIINYLQENEIAHNICITRAQEFSETSENIFNDVRMYIWARAPSFGMKDLSFKPAVCELFGHLVIQSEETYENITEDSAVEILHETTSKIYFEIKENVKKLVENSLSLQSV